MSKPTEAGLSWSGHKIHGDVESIRAVVDLMHGGERAASLGIEIANYAKKIVSLKEYNEKLEAIIAELRDSRTKLFVKFEKLENATKKPSNVLPIQTSVSEQTKIIANLRKTVADLTMERDHLVHLAKQHEQIEPIAVAASSTNRVHETTWNIAK